MASCVIVRGVKLFEIYKPYYTTNALKILVGKPLGKQHLRSPRM
jgi:hypothetical protein